MAAPIGKAPEGVPDETSSILGQGDVASFSFIVDHVIGDKKLQTNVFLPSSVGSAVRPYQEILLTKAFESCPLKAAMSGVVGKKLRDNELYLCY